MKRKNLIIPFLIVAVIITMNVCINQTPQQSALSLLSLANIEALAFPDDESSNGAASAIVTDLGSSYKCENDIYYLCNKYQIVCLGKGSMSCSSGVYEITKSAGECKTV